MHKIINNIFKRPYIWLVAAIFFYLLSLVFNFPLSKENVISSERKKLEAYVQKGLKEIDDLGRDSVLIKKLVNRKYDLETLKDLVDERTGIFIFRKSNSGRSELLFWNTQINYPPDDLHTASDGNYFEQLDNGYSVCVKETIAQSNETDSLTLIGLIPVFYQYYVSSDLLPDNFAYNKKASNWIELSTDNTSYPISDSKEEPLFYIKSKLNSPIQTTGKLAAFLKFFSVLLLLIFIQRMANVVHAKKGAGTSVITLVLILFVLRLISYYISFPLNLRQFELFDPGVYGSSRIHRSLGDLLINSILFCWIVLYIWGKANELFKTNLQKLGKVTGWGILAVVVLVLSTFFLANTVRSLAADSNISFDVTNFFSLSQYTAYGFATLSIMAIGFYFFVRILLLVISSFFTKNFWVVYFVIAVTGLTWMTFIIENPLLGFYMKVLIWLIFYVALQRITRYSINTAKLRMTGILFWIFLFSVSITTILISINKQKEWELRKVLADKIDIRTDLTNERQLSISLAYIDNDFLQSNFSRFKNEESAKLLRDSIIRDSWLLSHYNTRLYVFDENRKPLFNDNPETANILNTIINLQANKTKTENLYYYENPSDRVTYIFKREVRDDDGKFHGSLFIVANPEQYKSDALYAELFRNTGLLGPEDEKYAIYSYGIYEKGILLGGQQNNYAFATTISGPDIPVDQFTKRMNGQYVELWYKVSNEKIVVVARKSDSVIEAITLFSYIFCAFLLLVGLFNLFIIIVKVGVDLGEFKKYMQWNIRTQIHSTIVFISIFSFLVIGVATISFFIQRYAENNQEKLERTMDIMINEMENKLDKRQVFDDQLAIYDSASNQDVVRLVNEVSEIHNVDVNIYDTSGNLHVTSKPIIYREGYLSRKIHPLAFYHLNRLRQVQFVQQEKFSEVSYMSIYAPIRGEDGLAYAYLNIPYFLTQSGLKEEISNFLVTIIVLNAFIFLVAGVIALFITNRVTRSFSLISEKMKEVNLGKANEEIEWRKDDEIGKLVAEYNKMVKKLEVSADALARSEREGAWREMARQVAHEIKNPLTPMKLSIQYLQKSIDNNSSNVKELTANVARTLVEQIDHLSKIAFDFSQFANIGNTNPEKFDLKNILKSLGDLYQVNHDIKLDLNSIPDGLIVHSDKTQMNRLFTNLLQNAVEACNGKENCLITISAEKENGKIVVSVNDNGEGIPEVMQSKIFVPNFTTKSSGTGLGLAICKGIVEQARGKIWFETNKGEGSTFFVELPTAN